MMIHKMYIFITSTLTAGVKYAYHPWNVDSGRHSRVHPKRGFLPVGRDGYTSGQISKHRQQCPPQAPGANSSGYISDGEIGPAGAYARSIVTHTVYKIFATPNGCRQTFSLF